MRNKFLLIIFIFLSPYIFAQSPVVKLDIDMSGRTSAEVSDGDYYSWVPDNANTTTKVVSGVTFTFTRLGANGTALKADWYKAGVQAPNYARLVCDGIYVDGGNAGAQIELKISGLPAGTHSILTYHNTFSDPTTNTFAPLDISLNGNLIVNNLTTTNRSLTVTNTASSYITFNVASSSSVTTLLFKADVGTAATNKNIWINAIEINTPNVKEQATSPYPSHKDMHVQDLNGSVQLSWIKAPSATTHRVYFGTDSSCVATGTTTSSCFKGVQSSTTYTVSNLYNMEKYYWRIDEVTSSGVVTKGNVWNFKTAQLAFPGAEGYGRFAIGGRGGKVVHVTNLNDSGSGSLRDAVENQTGPRTIVFDVGGMIVLNSRLVLSDPYVTVAGQTAPGKGICIRTAPFGFTGNDLIVRHMRLRLGAGPTYDGMGMTGANNSILDHCSISWTIDEAFSSRSGKNITLQNTLISEALNAAGHQNYPAGTEHGYAATIGGDVGSFHHNLLAHCYGRNWSLGGGLDGNAYYAGRLDITNNVVYNWGGRATDGGAMEVNFVNNYYKPGAGSKIFYALSMDHENTGLGMQRAYFNGNVMPGKFDESTQINGRRETFSNGDYNKYTCFVSTPFFPSYVTTQSATDAYKRVLSDVGASQPQLDDHDIRMVQETVTGTYSVVGSVTNKPGFPDHQDDAGGYENYPTVNRASNWDTDKDGLPDFWESYNNFNVNSSASDFSDANSDDDQNGYTEIEEYINWMAETHYFVTTGSQTINLSQLFRGYTSSPTYTTSAIVNGTVTIANGSATFTANQCGFASFNITVKDANGATMTKSIGLFVSNSCSTTTVQKATLTKQGAGSSIQTITIGNSITAFSYAWNNATTVNVSGMPAGVVVLINNTSKTVSISGTPTETGTFVFTVSTIGGVPDSTRTGQIIVNPIPPKATLTKQGAGSSNQTISYGSSIVTFNYAWNFANTVIVNGVPPGITVDINTTTKIVTLSGTPLSVGVYSFSVTTVGGSPDSTRTGSMTINAVSTDIQSIHTNNTLVSPNPFSYGIFINVNEKYVYEIYNLNGQLVQTGQNIHPEFISLNVETGMYLLKIKTESFEYTTRMAKE